MARGLNALANTLGQPHAPLLEDSAQFVVAFEVHGLKREA